MKFSKVFSVICLLLLGNVSNGQSAPDTVRFIYATSKSDTALFSFTSDRYRIRYHKGRKVIKAHTDVPMKVNDQLYFFRRQSKTPVALLNGNRRLATFSGDTVIMTSGKYVLVIYSHLKWSYRKDGAEVLVCRYFSEKKVKNVILNFISDASDREVLTLIALEQARWMISKQGRLSNEGRLVAPPSYTHPAPPVSAPPYIR